MRNHLILVIILFAIASCKSSDNDSEQSYPLPSDPLRANQTFEYHEGIMWWDSLSKHSKDLKLFEYGNTDAGYPLHLAVLGADIESLAELNKTEKNILLINNAIHPGEPDGVDASMAYFRDLIMQDSLNKHLKNTVLVCIPFYNIGGALNRNYASRANQNGPLEYGFRGNAQNLDLNRDFIKCDSRNARTFAALLQLIDPDLYLETHVSNGADYQYTMTYLATQSDKLGFGMGEVLNDELIPYLEKSMKDKDEEMSPYVNVHGEPLDSSFTAFYDSPRYSTGLTTLHQTYGFITESHMLKPYDHRVKATYSFISSLVDLSEQKADIIKKSRKEAKEMVSTSNSFVLDWEIDSTKFKSFEFKGYEYRFIPSEITPSGITLEYMDQTEGRLLYDRSAPITKAMKYYAYFKPTKERAKPNYYVIPRGYHEVTDLLSLNGVNLDTLKNDTIIRVISTKITSFDTKSSAYEKHYFHFDTEFERDTIDWQFLKGDILIKMGSSKDRFAVEVLEPDAPDSYFNWNFFDAILQQKEWYSAYVFEDKAAEMLESNEELQKEFTEMWMNTPGFSSNRQFQLYWLYQHSDHYEKEHMRLPVFRIETE